jgi:hypothetical protein
MTVTQCVDLVDIIAVAAAAQLLNNSIQKKKRPPGKSVLKFGCSIENTACSQTKIHKPCRAGFSESCHAFVTKS